MGVAESWTLLSLGLVVIALRVYVRWTQVGPSKWQLDDYLMPLTGVVFTLETVAAYLVGALYGGLTNSYMTDDERANLDPNSTEYYNRQMGSKVQVIGWSFYACILWLLKISIAIFYSRLTNGLLHLRLRVRIAYGLLGLSYIVVALSILLGCQPMSRYWQIYPDPGNLCQPTISKLYVLIVLIPNVITDMYLLSIPLPLLWTVNIGMRRKLSLMFLFSGAIFVMMAGTIRAVVILSSGPEGAVTGSEWACRETFVAIVVANLPILQPLIRQGASKIGLSGIFSRTTKMGRSHPLGSQERNGEVYEFGKPANSQPRQVSRNTRWGSADHILGTEAGGGTPSFQATLPDKDIVIAHEVSITHEVVMPKDTEGTNKDSKLGHRSSASAREK